MTRKQVSALLIYSVLLLLALTFGQQTILSSSVSDAFKPKMQNRLTTVHDKSTTTHNSMEESNPNAMRARIASIKSEYRNFRRKVNNLTPKGQTNAEAIRNLTNIGNKLMEQIRILEETLNIKIRSDHRRQLLEEIIVVIKSQQFTEADKKIRRIGSLSPKINFIVHEIYDNNIGNFVLLNDYCKASGNVNISYSIAHALWYNMKANDHMDMKKLFLLYEAISSKVTNQVTVTNNIKNMWMRLEKKVSNIIVKDYAKVLTEAIILRNYGYNNRTKNIANSLYSLSDSLSDATMRKVIDDVYDETEKDVLVEYMYGSSIISQAVGAIMYIFQKFQEKGHVDDPATMRIAYGIKSLREDKDYNSSVSDQKKIQVENFIDQLPKSVYALYFSKEVGIKNVYYNDYIYNSLYLHDEERRYVFAGQVYNESVWCPKHYGGYNFEFINRIYSEYLYGAEIDPYDAKYRYVLTWKERLFGKSAWRIDLHGDEVSITNHYLKERLCVSSKKHSSGGRYVLTNMNDHNTDSKECRWQIVALSNNNR